LYHGPGLGTIVTRTESMAAFWENFLKHEFLIWKEFFVSPYIFPTALTALYFVQERARPTWSSFLFWQLAVILQFCVCTLLASAVMCVFGSEHVSMSPALAGYPLYFRFGLSSDVVNSILAQSNFYNHGYFAFYLFFIGVVAPVAGKTPFALIVGIVLSYVVVSVCLGLAFGIQHWILSFDWGWRPQDVPSVANIALPLAFSLWLLLLLVIKPLSTSFQRLISESESDILEPIMRIVITVLILAFALSGFSFLQPYQATLWLLFWIIVLPPIKRTRKFG